MDFNGDITPQTVQWLITCVMVSLFVGYYAVRIRRGDVSRLIKLFLTAAIFACVASFLLSVPFFFLRGQTSILYVTVVAMTCIRLFELTLAIISREYVSIGEGIKRIIYYGWLAAWIPALIYSVYYVVEVGPINENGDFYWVGNWITVALEIVAVTPLAVVGAILFNEGLAANSKRQAITSYLISALLLLIALATATEQIFYKSFGNAEFEATRGAMSLTLGLIAGLMTLLASRKPSSANNGELQSGDQNRV